MRETIATLIESACGRILSVVALALSVSTLTTIPVRANPATLVETGSTLLYPLFNIWVANYTKTHPGIYITTDATGSEAGIKKIISGEAQIGASDAFMSDTEVKRNPQIVNIPLCIAAQMVNYNLPGLNAGKLKLDGTVLAGIYSGKIRIWDSGAIPRSRRGRGIGTRCAFLTGREKGGLVIWHDQCRIQFPVNGIETVLRCDSVHSLRAFHGKRRGVRG